MGRPAPPDPAGPDLAQPGLRAGDGDRAAAHPGAGGGDPLRPGPGVELDVHDVEHATLTGSVGAWHLSDQCREARMVTLEVTGPVPPVVVRQHDDGHIEILEAPQVAEFSLEILADRRRPVFVDEAGNLSLAGQVVYRPLRFRPGPAGTAGAGRTWPAGSRSSASGSANRSDLKEV